MKTIDHYAMRRTFAILTVGLSLGSMLGITSHASIYQVGGLNSGGGVPAQATITSISPTATNCTLSWHGMQGWYTIQATTNVGTGPWNSLATVAATDFNWAATVANPEQVNSYSFRLSQANSYAGQGACSGCHGDKYAPWSQTAHASALSLLTSIGMGNNASCLPCHTVGYGQPTGYTNQTLTPNLANVGCEDCHGPAGWHKSSDHALIRPAVAMDPQICGSCHQDSHHPTYEEYVSTNTFGLFTGLSHSHATQSAATSTGCAVCHSANNRMVLLNEYKDMLAGNGHPLSLVTGSDATLWTATCATCHDPHSSNQVAQLRYPTHSTNWFTMPTTFDSRTVTITNGGVVTASTVNLNTVFDSLYNPNVNVCGQCHNTRGARWDGNAYAVVTNVPLYTLATNLAYVDTYSTNIYSQVFTNALGVPYLTNTYTSVYLSGRTVTTNVTSVQTNAPYGVAVVTPLIAYTNLGVVYYATNSSGYSRVQHYSPQYNILIGNVDYDYAAAGVPNKTHAHSSAPDQCVTCHVPNYAVNANTNVSGHTFAMDFNGCLTSCHSTYTADGLRAKCNNLQGIESNNMVRVTSLLNQWALNAAPAILRTNYAQLAWEFTTPGLLGTTDSKHKAGPASAYSSKLGAQPSGTNDDMQLLIPQDIRMARFDLYMAYNDQSMGVHNPTYVQALLDDAATRVSRQFTYANFTANNLAGFAPLTVKFTNTGNTNSVSGYNWTFGDGGNASVVNPTYVYNTPGIYAVTFTATTGSGSETLTKTNYIHVESAPVLSFVADQTNVTIGTTVNFTSTSTGTGDVALWNWYPRLGVSGAASYTTAGTVPGFSYAYTNTGTFSVELRATCQGGANGSYNRLQVTNTAYITVHN